MPQYSVTAFRWSGTGYNAQYNTSFAAIIDDDDPNLDGGSDGNETVSIDGGPFTVTAGPPYDINVSFTDVNGDPHVETFYFFNTAGSWYFIPGPGSAFTVGATLGSYQSHTTTPTPYSTITCFVRGTLIETDAGPELVENLRAGDLVRTADGMFQPLRISLSRRFSGQEVAQNPKLSPVRIVANALANGLPSRDLLVSRQHRILVSSNVCQRMFGEKDALVSAIRLTAFPGIFVEPDHGDVEYFHLVFDRHQVIYAEDVPAESFFPGTEALKSLPREARDEIMTIFPEIGDAAHLPEPAFQIPSAKRQRKLVARHAKNNQPFM